MTVRAILGLAFALVLGVTGPSQAFVSGVWQGGPDRDEDGRFLDCTMTAQAGSGILLAFVISRDGAWGLALADERWELNLGAVQDIELKIDAQAPVTTIAKVIDRHGILVPLANDDRLVSAMRNGKLLTISTETAPFSFELAGTSGALKELAACVAESLAAEKTKQTDFEGGRPDELAAVEGRPSAPQGRDPHRLFSESEAVVFAGELLSAAGIERYRLVDPSENPMPSFDVVWTYDNGIVAALVGYKEMGAVDLDEAANAVMADDAKNCKGDFASGRKISQPAKLVSVKRLFTSCRSAGKSVEIHYTLVKTRSGHLIQLAHLNLGAATGNVATADSAFLQASVLSSYK